jgi:Zn-dependent protease with chaperone function
MNEAMLPALAFVCSPQDVARLRAGNPANQTLATPPRHEDEAWSQIGAGDFPVNHALSLMAYLVVYAGIRGDADVIQKLRRLASKLGFAARFLRFVDKTLSPHYPAWLAACQNDPLALIVRPPDEVQRRINALLAEAYADGSYKSRTPMDGLSPKEYEHNLDRVCLDVLQKTKGLDTLMRLLSKHWNERFSTIRFTGSNLRLGPEQLPEIHGMFTEACGILEMKSVPKLYVQQQRVFNAFVTGIDDPIVVFTSEILEQLNYSEQLFIAGHELGHAKSEHILYSMIADLISGNVLEPLLATLGAMTLGFSGSVVLALKCALFNWQRASELTADRAGLLCCQDIDVAMGCLMRMAGTPPKYASSMNIEAFKNQAREFQELDFGLRDKLIKAMIILDSTHPWTIMRGHELLKWYEGGEYRQVLERATKREVSDNNQAPEFSFGELSTDEPAEELAVEGNNDGEGDAVFCTQCGTRQGSGSIFCSECGCNLK